MEMRVWRGIPILAGMVLLVSAAPTLAFLLPDTGQTKCYNTVSPYEEIACDCSGQDGAYSTNPLSYTGNGAGTVTDNNTGLMWQRQDDGATYTWYQASGTYDAAYNLEGTDVCGSLALGGYTDWRLPTKKELADLVDHAVGYRARRFTPSSRRRARRMPCTGRIVATRGGSSSAWGTSRSTTLVTGGASGACAGNAARARCLRTTGTGRSPTNGRV